MIVIKLPTGFNRKTFEKTMAKNIVIEYGEDGNPMVFTDHPLETKQRFIQFYGMVTFKMTVYDLEEKFDNAKKV